MLGVVAMMRLIFKGAAGERIAQGIGTRMGDDTALVTSGAT